jgi:UTP--glucose-1-phosphate uridylyltransferase
VAEVDDVEELSRLRDVDPIARDYRFDPELFASLRERYLSGGAAAFVPTVEGPVEPPGDLATAIDTVDEPTRAEGERAIAAGRVGHIVLAGGMGTRFGGVAKAAAHITPDLTFLDAKLRTCRTAPGPIALMVSYLTETAVAELLGREPAGDREVTTFAQSVMPRLRTDGTLLRSADGAVSYTAPGHGDLYRAASAAGLVDRLRAAGVEAVYVSNIDNIMGTLDPRTVGVHLSAGSEITLEVVEREDGDAGGFVASIDGRLDLVEGARAVAVPEAPPGSYLSTNNMLLSVDLLTSPPDLPWHAVVKKVDGDDAVQFEQLMGETVTTRQASAVVVPRHGDESHFVPIKTPDDLERNRDALVAAWRRRIGE